MTEYELIDSSGSRITVKCDSIADAREEAEEWALEGSYDRDQTIWIDVRIKEICSADHDRELTEEDEDYCAHGQLDDDGCCADCGAECSGTALDSDTGTCHDDYCPLHGHLAEGECNCDLDSDMITVTLEAEEPECPSPEGEHLWESPHSIVGGLQENPGVQGHGGGVICTSVCVLCGAGRTTDTWAQRSDTGEQGLESVSYDPPGHYDVGELLRARRLDMITGALRRAHLDPDDLVDDGQEFPSLPCGESGDDDDEAAAEELLRSIRHELHSAMTASIRLASIGEPLFIDFAERE